MNTLARLTAVLICVTGVWLHAGAAPAVTPAPTWKAGVASVVITPHTNMWMSGYASRTNVSDGKFHDLHAKALALEDAQGARLVVVTLDLIGVPRALRLALEKRAQDSWKLPPDQLLLNASHTHSGPEFRVGRVPGWPDFKPTALSEQYGVDLEEKLVKLIGAALTNRAPAHVGFSRARCGFAMNRRLPTPTGFDGGPYPEGPVDQDVPILRVDDAEGKTRAVLFGYACHNTTLALYKFCGDYAGFAQQYLEADHPGMTALFLAGCGGDQNPYPRGTVDLAQRHGRTLATAVEAALMPKPKPLNAPLRAAYATVEIDYAPPPSREEFQRRTTSKDRYEVQHAKHMLARIEKEGALPKSYPCPVQVVRFGSDLTLIAIGGETVVDYSLRLKKELANTGAPVWVAGYSNDVMGYIPSLRVLREGGYEAGGAMRYSATHPGPWSDTVEERIIAKIHQLHDGLRGK
ncbi:MAG: hypothetical protein EXS22_09950 [Pedosphaera sp.]|nr:hypothetical protein [Pedosphaera sp.]